MANDLNSCSFIGRLGKDVEMRFLPSGKAVASFSIACGENWKDQQGQKQERTEWVNITAFDKLAEIIGEYLVKGSKVYIQGKMKTEKYTDNNGVEKYSTKIIAQNMQMLDSKPQDGGQQQQSSQRQPAQNQAPAQRPPAQQQGNAAYQAPQQGYSPAPQQQGMQMPAGDGWQDDIPFAPIGLQCGRSLIHSM